MIKRQLYETIYGNIDYSCVNGVLVINGAIVYKEWRGTGKFKRMLKSLFLEFPDGTRVQTATNKKLAPMFERLGFKRVKKIEYWGSPANCILLEGYIVKNNLSLL